MNRSSPESEAPSDLRIDPPKVDRIQWLEASFRCMEREKRGSDC
jgi:hypothetical protein